MLQRSAQPVCARFFIAAMLLLCGPLSLVEAAEGRGKLEGKIMLTDHRAEVWYRNIEFRLLSDEKSAGKEAD